MRRLAFLALVSLLAATTGETRPRELGFDERVAAQRAIERVYSAHQIGATLPFEDAVPHAVLEQKVENYLKQSAALAALWDTPITADMLKRELERMDRQTRLPERLGELYAALGHDSVLIHECLARPALAGRLARNFFAFDSHIHARARSEGEDLHAALDARLLDPFAEHPRRTTMTLVRRSGASEEGEPADRAELDPADYDRWAARAPAIVGRPGPLLEQADRWVVHVTLARRDGEIDLASFTAPKESWDEWWRRVQDDFDAGSITPVAEDTALVTHSVSGSGCADDTWDFIAEGRNPDPRMSLTAVWTGSRVVLWGGLDYALDRVNTGGRYDPATDTWEPTSLVNAPSPRSNHAVVWTGSRMVVWGGENRIPLKTGGRYDPTSDSWEPTTVADSPSARSQPAAVWTGNFMLVWGGGGDGGPLGTGGGYDPVNDTWFTMSNSGAPSARYAHTAVWSGSQMLVWGGGTGQPAAAGARYDPVADTWAPLSTVNAPGGRLYPTAIWSGSEMIVWGGYSGGVLGSGGRYDPASNSWSPVSTTGAPAARQLHTAVWSGEEMFVWGGTNGPGTTSFSNGGRYDPVLDFWTPISTGDAPSGRSRHAAVWTGSQMVVWGGGGSFGTWQTFNTGGRYDPASDSWTPTATSDVPYPRSSHVAVWTGNLMVIWGGFYSGPPIRLDTGGRFDPATATWTATSLADAPAARYSHTAVWTGSRMIVWGGTSDSSSENTGALYDPLADSWTPTSTIDAPAGRKDHATVWTGDVMLVWGGSGSPPAPLDTGARYDPVTDTWSSTSRAGAPPPRDSPSAVWTGSEMIVWGGTNDTLGGRYDPDRDVWAATSTVGAPSARRFHSAVWTGSEMLIWGGIGSLLYNDGKRYDPLTDQWQPISMVGAPSHRFDHSALWTGNEMLVWGGEPCSGTCLEHGMGGRYDPIANEWTPISTAGAPTGRSNHTAVWTGSRMLVWGGHASAQSSPTEYMYCGCFEQIFFEDLDGDGYGDPGLSMTACSQPDGFVPAGGDCNDADATAWGTPGEVRDLRLSDSTLSWTPPADPGSTIVLYDVLRTDVATDFVGNATCIASDHSDTQARESASPPAGVVYFYLVRAQNSCPDGEGSLGTDSNGAPRTGRSCP